MSVKYNSNVIVRNVLYDEAISKSLGLPCKYACNDKTKKNLTKTFIKV